MKSTSKFTCGAIALLASFVLSVSPCAASVIVNISGQSTYVPGQMSDPFTVSIIDTDLASPDALLGWQLSLQVIGGPGATGTVGFVPAQLPQNDYLLDGVNFGLTQIPSAVQFANDSLLAFDFDSRPATSGVIVPGNSGAPVLELRLQASPDASGPFEVVAIPGAGNSEFTNPSLLPTEFGNLPAGAGPVSFGTITAIPEPSAATIALLIGIGAYCRRGRRA